MEDFINCNKCRDAKPLSDFDRRPDSKSGYRRTCKACRRRAKNATNSRYYQRHAVRIREKSRAQRRANIESHRQSERNYRQKNADRINARQRQYYYRNRGELLARKREDYAGNPQKYRDRAKAFRELNLSKYRERDAAYYRNNREVILLRLRLRRAANPQKYRDRDALRRIVQADRRRASDRLYHLRNKERRNQKSREYYASHKATSLDYGWENGLPHDRQMMISQQNDADDLSATASVELIMESLPSVERAWCQRFLDDGDQIPDAILESIRKKIGAE